MTTMQRLLQLPVNAVNIVKTVQSQVQGQEEDKSPVLSPDSGQQTWYSALQPDELRHLRSGGTGGGGGGGGGGDQEERGSQEDGGGGGSGVGSFQSQPLRHDDLKEMLDSNKDSLKLEAMKRIVAVSVNEIYFGFLLISKSGSVLWEEKECYKNTHYFKFTVPCESIRPP
ncbi:hypothetical protein ATANTOWER_029560 [Ataeniobius toweri]|uniref:Uncharacterized protein n=1 Tax=Ataeniobius toweri TaxID=208326 RepID=A0ABU7BWW9_9TELE|nr:hypothetical protein [Ataeniobius toweri]